MTACLILAGENTEYLAGLCKEFGINCQISTIDRFPEPSADCAVWVSGNADTTWLAQLWASGARIVLDGIGLPDAEETVKHTLDFERLVVNQASHPITAGFKKMDILDANLSEIIQLNNLEETARVPVQASRVAGFDKAEYGITEKSLPIIAEVSPGRIISAVQISSCMQRRYTPGARWKRLAVNLLMYLTEREPVAVPEFPESVPMPFTEESRRKEKYTIELKDAAGWYHDAEMLIKDDGSEGVLEGFRTVIDAEGNQELCLHAGKPNERADCNIQSAFAFLTAGKALQDEGMTLIGQELLGFTIREFQYHDQSVFRGLWSWFRRGYESKVFYADDNGWSGFLPLLWGVLENDNAALTAGLETAVGVRNTWGKNGHRRRRINWEHFFEQDGREGLRKEVLDQPGYGSPHYEAASMALMGLASWVTGDMSFIDCCKAGLDEYMEVWPQGIVLQHAENDDGSKLLVALLFAFLATGDEKYKTDAAALLQPFIERQDICGAIPEIDRIGERYGRNRDNAGYGTFESSIFQNDGDPVTDQIYGSSFLALALVFYNWIIADPAAAEAQDKLLDYLCNIQIKDTDKTFLNGTWMRSFDYKRWEYFGAAGDWGWGPFAIETGWDTSIIMIATAFRMTGKLLPENADSIQEKVQTELKHIEEIHAELEKNWKEHTPLPEARNIEGPDLMI